MHLSNPLDAAATISDAELLSTVRRLAANERQATAQLVAHLSEIDARRLYLGEGCSSLFTYCTQVLHLSEHAAYARIEAARAARRFPAILEAVAKGALHLTAVTLIGPHLTVDNVDRIIAAATHKAKRDVEELVATLRPLPPVPASVRKVPQTTQVHSRPTAGAAHANVPVSYREAGVTCAPASVTEVSGAGESQPAVQRMPPGGNSSAGARTVPCEVHGLTCDARQASRGPGPAAAPGAFWRSGRGLRPRADAAVDGTAQDPTRRHISTACEISRLEH